MTDLDDEGDALCDTHGPSGEGFRKRLRQGGPRQRPPDSRIEDSWPPTGLSFRAQGTGQERSQGRQNPRNLQSVCPELNTAQHEDVEKPLLAGEREPCQRVEDTVPRAHEGRKHYLSTESINRVKRQQRENLGKTYMEFVLFLLSFLLFCFLQFSIGLKLVPNKKYDNDLDSPNETLT